MIYWIRIEIILPKYLNIRKKKNETTYRLNQKLMTRGITYKNLWDAVSHTKNKYSLNTFIRKYDIFKISKLRFQLKKLRKKIKVIFKVNNKYKNRGQ